MNHIICLIDRGDAALAVVLLQRFVAENPGDRDAEMRLGKLLGDASGHPADAGRMTGPVRFDAWVASEFGHDSNINRAASAKMIEIPLLNYRSLSLPDLLVQRGSSFAGLLAGAEIRLPLSGSLKAELRAQAGVRGNFSEQSYLPHNYSGLARLEKNVGRSSVGIRVSVAQQWVAKYRLLERSGLRLHVSTPLTDVFDVSLSAEEAGNTYPMFENLRTRERSKEIRIGYAPLKLQFGVYWGDEDSSGPVKDLDRSFNGLSGGWRLPINETCRLAIDVSTGTSSYRQFSRLFATQRKDSQTEVVVAVQFRLGDGWSLAPRISVERNRSSMALNGYRRAQYLAELRKDF